MATLTVDIYHPRVTADAVFDFTSEPVSVVMGPSGAGKTTLLQLIAGLQQPEDGTVVWNRETWWDPNHQLPVHRRQIGMVWQTAALFPHMSIVDNVTFALRSMPRGNRRQRAYEALDMCGAQHLTDRTVRQLSGGEAQRVSLARAIAPDPQLLLMDEPLSALDSVGRQQLREDLRAVLDAAHIPTIVVTHDLTDAVGLGDHLFTMRQGILTDVGSLAPAVQRPPTPDVADVLGVATNTDGGTYRGFCDDTCDHLIDHDTLGLLHVADVPPSIPVMGRCRVSIPAADWWIDDVSVNGGHSNEWIGEVIEHVDHGLYVSLTIDLGRRILAHVSRAQARRYPVGATVTSSLDPSAVLVYPWSADTGGGTERK